MDLNLKLVLDPEHLAIDRLEAREGDVGARDEAGITAILRTEIDLVLVARMQTNHQRGQHQRRAAAGRVVGRPLDAPGAVERIRIVFVAACRPGDGNENEESKAMHSNTIPDVDSVHQSNDPFRQVASGLTSARRGHP